MIPNCLIEALARTVILSCGQRILQVIIRETLGWRKQEATISFRKFKETTGMKGNSGVHRAIKQLEWQHIIKVKRFGRTKTLYSLQTDFTLWRDWNCGKRKFQAAPADP